MVKALAHHILGRPIRPRDLAGLAGAPDWAEVVAGTLDDGVLLEIQADRGALLAIRSLEHRDTGPVLVNQNLRISGSEAWCDAQIVAMFRTQMRTAQRLGVLSIICEAEPPQTDAPRFPWPLLGFDAPLPATLRLRLPAALQSVISVLDLVEQDQGRAWWQYRQHLPRLDLTFDLRRDSRSMQVFERYLVERHTDQSDSDAFVATPPR